MEDVTKLAGPQKAEEYDSCRDWDSRGPVRPLTQVCISHVLSVYAEDARH